MRSPRDGLRQGDGVAAGAMSHGVTANAAGLNTPPVFTPILRRFATLPGARSATYYDELAAAEFSRLGRSTCPGSTRRAEDVLHPDARLSRQSVRGRADR